MITNCNNGAAGSSSSGALPNGSTSHFCFSPVRSDFSAFLDEILSIWWRHNEVQVAVFCDLEDAALKEKRLREEDRAFEQARTAPLFPDSDAPLPKPVATNLLCGRPRTPAVVVFIAAMVCGFTGSAYGAESRTLLLESISLHALLSDLGHKLPAANTLGPLVNRLSQTTLDLIHRAQLADYLGEGLDSFKDLTIDSTAIKASSCWPTDANIIYRLFERCCRMGEKLARFGLPPLDVVRKEVLLTELKNHMRAIALLGSGPQRQRQLKLLYEKFYKCACTLSAKVVEANERLALCIDTKLLKLKPSLRQQAEILLRQIHQDGIAAIKTIQQSIQRVQDGISTKAREKVLSLADQSAAYIEKGGREAVLGYKPQLARSASGFVTALLLEEGNGADCQSLLPLVNKSITNTGVIPSNASTDDGYASKAVLDAVHKLGVELVSISGSKGRKLLGDDLWNSPQYSEQRCKRSAVESLMFTLKYNHDFGRPGRRGLTAVRSELTLKVIAYNFDHAQLVRERKQPAIPLPIAA